MRPHHGSSAHFLFLQFPQGAVGGLTMNWWHHSLFTLTGLGSFSLVVNCTVRASVHAFLKMCLSHMCTCMGACACTYTHMHRGIKVVNPHLSSQNPKCFQFTPTSKNLHGFSSVMAETFELLEIIMLPSRVQAIPGIV